MKKFLIAGTSLAAVAAAGSAGAVDVTLGGSINMGIDFGLGKSNGNLVVGEAFNEVSLSINAAHTTDGGLAFGGGFTMGAATELEFAPYTDGGAKFAARMTVDGRTNIAANLWNVSGGGSVAADNVVSVKINSDWLGIDQEQEAFTLALGSFTSSNICKLAGRGNTTADSSDDVSLIGSSDVLLAICLLMALSLCSATPLDVLEAHLLDGADAARISRARLGEQQDASRSHRQQATAFAW